MQTIKRVAAILLVLTLVLSCFPTASVAVTAGQSETVPVSTDAAAVPTDADADPPASPDVSPGDAATVTAATEMEPPVSVEISEEPVSDDTTETPQTLTGLLAGRDAPISVILPDARELDEGAVLTVSDAEPDGDTMMVIMEKAGIGAVLDYCVFDAYIEGAELSDIDISISLDLLKNPLNALRPSAVYVAGVSADGTVDILTQTSTKVPAARELIALTFITNTLSADYRFVILTADMPTLTATYSQAGIGNYFTVPGGYQYDSNGNKIYGMTYHYLDENIKKAAYCMEPGKKYNSTAGASRVVVTGTGVSSAAQLQGDASITRSVWNRLTDAQRQTIALILCYGLSTENYSDVKSYNMNSANGFTGQSMYLVCQAMVWGAIKGYNDPSFGIRSPYVIVKAAGNTAINYYNTLNTLISNWKNGVTEIKRVDIEKSQYAISCAWSGSQCLAALELLVWETGGLRVTKAVDGTGSVADWRFEVYETEDKAKAGNESDVVAYAYTDSSGVASFTDLYANITYYVREAPAERQDRHQNDIDGWTLSTTILSERVLKDVTTTSVGTITNTASGGEIQVKKAVNTADMTGKLNGWVFQVATDTEFQNIVSTITTDADGNGTTGATLATGTYYVREAPMSAQTRPDKENFILDPNAQYITVVIEFDNDRKLALYSSDPEATAVNTEKGRIRVRKGVGGADETSANLSGWLFYVYKDEACTDLAASVTTDGTGYGTTSIYLEPGSYWVQEAPVEDQTRSDKALWGIDDTVVSVYVDPGETAEAYPEDGFTAENCFGKYIHLAKSASDIDCYEQLIGNDMYSLAGAQYQIIVNGEVTETVTTGEDGAVLSSQIYTIGTTGTIKEIAAPAGYLLDPAEHAFTIEATAEAYCYVSVKDEPTFDPVRQIFRKTDSETGIAQGDTTFEDAIFRWDYYDNTDWSGAPVRTWYFSTNDSGQYGYNADYLVNDPNYTSSELYTSVYGVSQVPLGSIKVTEVSAPLGYTAMPDLYATITQSSNGAIADFSWTADSLAYILSDGNGIISVREPEDTTLLASVEIQKLDKDFGAEAPAWSTFAGCEFTIYNRSTGPVKVGNYAVAQPGDICYVLTVDAKGKAAADNVFPIGTYEIKETKGNEYYQCNTDWSYTFTVTGEEDNPVITAECANTMYPATITLQKVNTGNQPLPGTKFALEWSEDGITWQKVTKSDEIVMGGCSSPDLDEDGCLITGDDGIATFTGLHPVVNYRITEVEVPNGYQLLKDPILVEQLQPEDEFEITYRVVNNDVFQLPKTGIDAWIWPLLLSFSLASAVLFFSIFVETKQRKE